MGRTYLARFSKGAAFLPFLILIAVLAAALLLLLQGQPIRPYARIFFIGGALCVCAEGLVGSLLGAYQVRAGLLANPFRDMLLAGVFVSGFIHPLMAVLYVRLAPGRHVKLALAAAVLLALLEIWFVFSGYMQYRMWHPVLSGLFYFGFLMADWQIFSGRWALPFWVCILSMAFWLITNSSHLLHGVLGLWQYPVTMSGNPILGSHLASNLYEIAITIPVAALASSVPSQWPRVVRVAGGALVLVAAQTILHATGGVIFIKWNLWLSAVRYAAEIGAVSLYAQWRLEQGDRMGLK